MTAPKRLRAIKDRRSTWARRHRELASAFEADLGPDLSAADRSFADHCATVALDCEPLKVRQLNGEAVGPPGLLVVGFFFGCGRVLVAQMNTKPAAAAVTAAVTAAAVATAVTAAVTAAAVAAAAAAVTAAAAAVAAAATAAAVTAAPTAAAVTEID
jgi:hypothetical protein